MALVVPALMPRCAPAFQSPDGLVTSGSSTTGCTTCLIR